MAYSVHLSQAAEVFLADLAARTPHRARELALHLLSLRKEPCPQGSRELRPRTDPVAGARFWVYPPFEITYQVDRTRRRVNVGAIQLSPRHRESR